MVKQGWMCGWEKKVDGSLKWAIGRIGQCSVGKSVDEWVGKMVDVRVVNTMDGWVDGWVHARVVIGSISKHGWLGSG